MIKIDLSFRKVSYIGLAILILVLLALSFTRIEPGYAGVVYNPSGGVEGKVLGQGWHLVLPWKKVTSYPVSTETVYLSKDDSDGDNTSFDVSTKDGKLVNVDSSTFPESSGEGNCFSGS